VQGSGKFRRPGLGRAVWDAEVVRDDLRAFVAGRLGHVTWALICDETEFKGNPAESRAARMPLLIRLKLNRNS
jgi:hypothetical protein